MGFFTSKADSDIWMRKNEKVYEYIAIYLDDLCIVAIDPKKIIYLLTEKYLYRLKGSGPIEFHLGCDYFRDSDKILCYAPKRYIEKMIAAYKGTFGTNPKEETSPLVKGDHPELDDSEELGAEGIKQYQSMIGAMQWAVSLGRLDITTAVMTMSGYRVAPRQGHLDRCKRIYEYLSKMRHLQIKINTSEPDFSELTRPAQDWKNTVYGDTREEIPHNLPEPLGKYVTLTTYVDANLYHDMLSGRSVTGILHLINKTPFDWYSKKQATVETATYGLEFVAARHATEQIIDHRISLRYLGVSIREHTYMFGDNESVVGSGSKVDAKLHNRHTALSFD
jgi:hypothetical protein